MSEHIDEFLEAEGVDGTLDSEGSFSLNLREAARKFALFGQRQRSLWTLKIGQGFERLGCHSLEISTTKDSWMFVGRGCRRLDLDHLHTSLSTVGLSGSSEAENFLALGIGALSISRGREGLIGARWVGARSELIFGEADDIPSSPGCEILVLQFPGGEAPAFPHLIWGQNFAYSTMEITYCFEADRRSHLNGANSANFMRPETPLWMEYLADGHSSKDLRLNTAGQTHLNLGPEVPWQPFGFASRIRWRGQSERCSSSIIVMVHDQAAGASVIHPVLAGCLLESLATPELPEGFSIVLNADSCRTDLGHTKLREGPELEALIDSCRQPISDAIEILLDRLKGERSMVTKPKTPLAVDLAPGCLGCLSPFCLPLFFIDPYTATAVFSLMGGLPALHFWLSRSKRNQEFEVLKLDADRLLRQRRNQLTKEAAT